MQSWSVIPHNSKARIKHHKNSQQCKIGNTRVTKCDTGVSTQRLGLFSMRLNIFYVLHAVQIYEMWL